jgi:hypothetical protein
MSAAVDNDVIFKGACYRLLSGLIPEQAFGDRIVLGAARFVVRSRIARSRLTASELAQADAASFFDRATIIEPTDSELGFAGALEHAAQAAGLSLDGGESLLLAVVLNREIGHLITGDKRAIASIEVLLAVETRLAGVCGLVVCLEQLVKGLLAEGRFADVREAICAAAGVDRALSLCFSCTNDLANEDSAHEGLESHINSLRACAGRVLSS